MNREGWVNDLTGVNAASEPEHALTLGEFSRKRGYDPKTRTYSEDDAPDTSGRYLHKISH